MSFKPGWPKSDLCECMNCKSSNVYITYFVRGNTVMKTMKATTIILLLISSSALVATEASARDKSNLEVLDIRMEPIH